MSMLVAFTITPWLSYHALRESPSARPRRRAAGWSLAELTRALRAPPSSPFLDDRAARGGAARGDGALVRGGGAPGGGARGAAEDAPFDNKNEFQIVVDMPEGTTLERTDAAARRAGRGAAQAPEVTRLRRSTAASRPDGLQRPGAPLLPAARARVADIRVNLVPQARRASMQSHALALRLRDELEAVAAASGRAHQVRRGAARPAGHRDDHGRDLRRCRRVPYDGCSERGAACWPRGCSASRGRGDVDTTVEAEQTRRRSSWPTRRRRRSSGSRTQDVAQTLAMAAGRARPRRRSHVARRGEPAAGAPAPAARERARRRGRCARLYLKGRPGYRAGARRGRPARRADPDRAARRARRVRARPRGEDDLPQEPASASPTSSPRPPAAPPAEVIADVGADLEPGGTPTPTGSTARPLGRAHLLLATAAAIPWALPAGTARRLERGGRVEDHPRRLPRPRPRLRRRAASASTCCSSTRPASYAMPLILMISIPLTVIGIMPGFWLLNAARRRARRRLPEPGLLHRDGDDRHDRAVRDRRAQRHPADRVRPRRACARGEPLRDALLECGRGALPPDLPDRRHGACWRPSPITLDPIFSGPRLGADLRPVRLDGVHAGGDPGDLRPRLPRPRRARAPGGDGGKPDDARDAQCARRARARSRWWCWPSSGSPAAARTEDRPGARAAGRSGAGAQAAVATVRASARPPSRARPDHRSRRATRPCRREILARIEEVRLRAGMRCRPARCWSCSTRATSRRACARRRRRCAAPSARRDLARAELRRVEASSPSSVASQQDLDRRRSEVPTPRSSEVQAAEQRLARRPRRALSTARSAPPSPAAWSTASPSPATPPSRARRCSASTTPACSASRCPCARASRCALAPRPAPAGRGRPVGPALRGRDRRDRPARRARRADAPGEGAPARRAGPLAGMFGRVEVPAGETDRAGRAARRVERDRSARVRDVVPADRPPERRLVTTGRAASDTEVEVLSGLAPGERVLRPAEAGAIPPPAD